MSATASGRRARSTVARGGSVPRRFLIGALVFASAASVACRDTTEPVDTCANIQDISLGVPVNGSLSLGDCQLLQDDSFVDYWRLVVSATSNVQIDLTSTAFDAFVILRTVAGANLDSSDEGGEVEGDARLTVTLNPGTYHILANSFSATETGAYQLTAVIVP